THSGRRSATSSRWARKRPTSRYAATTSSASATAPPAGTCTSPSPFPSDPMRQALLAAAVLFASAAQADAGSWFRERFIDPQDGEFDMSNFLLDHHGAFAIPIVITEPAVGYGGGLALAWFSESIRQAAERAKQQGTRVTPPNITA